MQAGVKLLSGANGLNYNVQGKVAANCPQPVKIHRNSLGISQKLVHRAVGPKSGFSRWNWPNQQKNVSDRVTWRVP
jgi:hypothetical protein